jgi:hypothetical protein
VRDAQVVVTDKEGTVIAENVRRKAMAEAAGREAEAAAIEKTGLAEAVGLRERLLAEVTAKEAEAGAIEKRMLAEAKGLAEKANAMKALDGSAREHEEFRLQLENQRQIALEQIKARVQMTEAQSRVMAEAMSKADIKIVGGDGQFFDRFVNAVALGNQIDGVVDHSDVVRGVLGDRLNGNGKLIEDVKQLVGAAGGSSETIKNLTVSAVLASLLGNADDRTKPKLQALLDKARQLGLTDDKLS